MVTLSNGYRHYAAEELANLIMGNAIMRTPAMSKRGRRRRKKNCVNKRWFETQQEAKEFKPDMRVYHCWRCGKFHLATPRDDEHEAKYLLPITAGAKASKEGYLRKPNDEAVNVLV
jgi:hypothetical protein